MISRRSFVKASGLSLAAAMVLPRGFAEDESFSVLEEFPYGAVRLAPGLAQTQFEQTQSVLLQMNIDSLLKPWRQRAGLPAPGPDMGGWYDEGGFAPGHALGQWISALARGYAVNKDAGNRTKLEQILNAYEPAISGRFYTNFRFPAYNYDKVVCGLIDAHQFCGFDPKFALLDRTTEAAEPHLPPRALDRDEPQRQWRKSIGEQTSDDYGWDEPYTLPENLFMAWHRGAGDRYKQLASRFLLDETYFDPLAEGRNVLPKHHAYSFCNALSSAMQAYLSNGSTKHLAAARNAFEMIRTTQSFVTGGWGPDEQFRDPNGDDLYNSLRSSHQSFETPCGSYAHFKLTRYLLRVTRDGRYGDSMEQVLYNTVLGARPLQNDGRAFYYSDYNFSGSKVFFPDPWPCCSGTLPQVAADYHVMIYFRDARGVYVNLYLPSELKWTANNGVEVRMTQSGGYPLEGKIALNLHMSKSTFFTVRLRIPEWASSGGKIQELLVNEAPAPLRVDKGFAELERLWTDGDRIELHMAMPVRVQGIDKRRPRTVALMRGPLVLFPLHENPRIRLKDAMFVHPGKHGKWRAGETTLAPFWVIRDEKYSTYFELT